MHNHALVREIASLEGTFLGELSSDNRERLLADAVFLQVPAGAPIFLATDARIRNGVVLRGMARTHLTSANGRRLSVRFSRPGTLIGTLNESRALLSVQAVIPTTVLELNWVTLLDLVTVDGRVGLALLNEMVRRLNDVHATLASNTFGSMRERVARQLLDLATEVTHTDQLVAPVTQQGLADGVGTVREVVARVLRDFRSEGLIATSEGSIEILDPGAMASLVGRSRSR